uniref:Uncharacterized protein n=1 Tax=Anguilla anguilla TaxID=7936 RepID=A0A0E9W623_ANGAN
MSECVSELKASFASNKPYVIEQATNIILISDITSVNGEL